MRRIKQDELFQGLGEFLKGKGIELKDGAYAERIQRACSLLGDAINATQRTARKAKNDVDKTLEQVRQRIHEATAPKPPFTAAPKPGAPGAQKTKQTRPTRKRRRPAKPAGGGEFRAT